MTSEETTMPRTREEIAAWLTAYAWLGDEEAQAREVACIMSQDGWQYIAARADQYAGAQAEPGPDAYEEGIGWALSALYECHDGPHTVDCPRNHD